MYAGDELIRGARVPALNDDYNLVHQYDGNVVIYKTKGAEAQWASNTAGKETTHFKFEKDGNMKLYNGHCVVWKFDLSTLHHPHGPPYSLIMQDNGEVALNDKDLNYLGGFGEGLSMHHGDFDHSKLPIGGILPTGGSLFTRGRVSAINFTDTGDLVLMDSTETLKTLGAKGGKFLVFQDDGSFLLYGEGSKPVWDFKTTGCTAEGAKAVMILKNGNLVLVDDDSAEIISENAEKHVIRTIVDFSKL